MRRQTNKSFWLSSRRSFTPQEIPQHIASTQLSTNMSNPNDLLKAPTRPFLLNKGLVITGLGVASLSASSSHPGPPSAACKPRITVCERGSSHPDSGREGHSVNIRPDKRSKALQSLGVLTDFFRGEYYGAQ